MTLDHVEARERQPLSGSSIRPQSLLGKPGRWIRVCVLLLATVTAPILQANPESAANQSAAETPRAVAVDEYYDDPDAEYLDDGSRAIRETAGASVPDSLTPIGPLEESGLLGNWGDAEDEAED